MTLVAIISSLVTVFTKPRSEGFMNDSDVIKVIESMTPEQSATLKALNDEKYVKLEGDRVVMKVPLEVNGEVRVVGEKDSYLSLNTKGDKKVRIRIAPKEMSQYLSSLPGTKWYEQGSTPLLFEVMRKDGGVHTIGSLPGHSHKYETRGGYIPGFPKGYVFEGDYSLFKTKDESLVACDANPYCKGVTYDRRINRYTLRGGADKIRKGMKVQVNYNNVETSYVKKL